MPIYKYLMLVIICVACTNTKKRTIAKIAPVAKRSINFYEVADSTLSIKLSSIAKDIEYVQLQTNKRSTLQKIEKLEVTDHFIFANDFSKILQFDREGRFIRKIGSTGKAHSEYLKVRDFTLDRKKRRIYVYAHYKHKILSFDYEGNFINSFSTKNNVEQIEILNSSKLVTTTVPEPNNNSTLCVIDTTGRILNKYVLKKYPRLSKWNTFRESSLFRTTDNQLKFLPFLADTIYTLDNKGQLTKNYTINLKEHKPTYREAFLSLGANTDKSRDNIFTHPIVETNNFVLFVYKHLAQNHIAIFDKRNSNSYKLVKKNGKNGFMNDIDGGYSFIPKMSYNGMLIGWYNAMWFKEKNSPTFLAKRNAISPSQKEKLSTLVKSISYSDNPIIMIIKTTQESN